MNKTNLDVCVGRIVGVVGVERGGIVGVAGVERGGIAGVAVSETVSPEL